MNADEIRRIMGEHEIDEWVPAGTRVAAVQRRVAGYRRRTAVALAVAVAAVVVLANTALGARHRSDPITPRPTPSSSPTSSPTSSPSSNPSSNPSSSPTYLVIPVAMPTPLPMPLPTSTETRDGLPVYHDGTVLVADATGPAGREVSVVFTVHPDTVYHLDARCTDRHARITGTVDGQRLLTNACDNLGSVTYGANARTHQARLQLRITGTATGTVTAIVRGEVPFAAYRFPPNNGGMPRNVLPLAGPSAMPTGAAADPTRPQSVHVTWSDNSLSFILVASSPGQFVFAVDGTPVLVQPVWGWGGVNVVLTAAQFTRPPAPGTPLTITVTAVNASGAWAVVPQAVPRSPTG